jgi:hypothetical protein
MYIGVPPDAETCTTASLELHPVGDETKEAIADKAVGSVIVTEAFVVQALPSVTVKA